MESLLSFDFSSWRQVALSAADERVTDNNDSTMGFFKAIEVWINKPQVINRRVCGAQIMLQKSTCDFSEALKIAESFITNDLEKNKKQSIIPNSVELHLVDSASMCVIVRILMARQAEKNCNVLEVLYIDRESKEATFIPLSLPIKCCLSNLCESEGTERELSPSSLTFPYKFKLTSDAGIKLLVLGETGAHDSSLLWLKTSLFEKITSWSRTNLTDTSQSTLKLVDVKRYNNLYHQLKKKYGPSIIEKWPENTDPQKFVHEDIGIASYLLLIWENERETKGVGKQSFVDLGCGNGLLVHILSSEGHRGIGVDIRRRAIWDMFGPGTILKEQSIVPSDCCLYPGYDWLIGNHSDELTPWIPVMASRSSYNTNYFVLPCCPHDFDSKFKSRASSSLNKDYLDFICEVGQVCGFAVEGDTLRIPSTKKVCFIGRSRTYRETEAADAELTRRAYIEKRCSVNVGILPCIQAWSSEFKVRKEESTSNCTNVPIHVQNSIIQTTFKAVLLADTAALTQSEDGRPWHQGGTVPLSDVYRLIDKDLLAKLKNESGGLQTLLRNQFQVFCVSGGCIQLRNWLDGDPRSRYKKKKDTGRFLKTKLCWFYRNHPDGCPKSDISCPYAHKEEELKAVKC